MMLVMPSIRICIVTCLKQKAAGNGINETKTLSLPTIASYDTGVVKTYNNTTQQVCSLRF
jgi:hypothetical protein